MAETRAATIPAERPALSPVCAFCARLEDAAIADCEAFDEIPVPIWLGDNDHTRPYAGDGGLRFELIGADEQKKASEPPNDPELPDLDDDEAWQRFEEESNKRIQKSGKRSAGELLSFARPYNYAGKLNEHQAGFRATMQGLAAQLRDGKIDHGQWSYQSKVEIMRHTADGYRIGVAQAKGITPAKVKLSAADRQGIATAVKEQYKFFSAFSKTVSDKIAAGEVLTTGVDSRAGLYAGAVRSAASQAKVSDDPEKMLRWQRHKNDSCSTCLSMEGKTKSAKDWQEGGILPASGTECHGNCGCSLDPVA